MPSAVTLVVIMPNRSILQERLAGERHRFAGSIRPVLGPDALSTTPAVIAVLKGSCEKWPVILSAAGFASTHPIVLTEHGCHRHRLGKNPKLLLTLFKSLFGSFSLSNIRKAGKHRYKLTMTVRQRRVAPSPGYGQTIFLHALAKYFLGVQPEDALCLAGPINNAEFRIKFHELHTTMCTDSLSHH